MTLIFFFSSKQVIFFRLYLYAMNPYDPKLIKGFPMCKVL